MKKDIVIFDLDGTLAIINQRRQKAMKPNGKLNWDKFSSDELIKKDFVSSNKPIYFF
tara:strand:- start:190 stop:360 length:171 start_codon:yes stop_codon:yes gene_type:complete